MYSTYGYYYPTPVSEWEGGGVEVLELSDFTKLCKKGELTDDDGTAYPVRNEMTNLEAPILPSNLSAVPLDATHVLWFPT